MKLREPEQITHTFGGLFTQEEITNTMNLMKARLDKEIAGHAETRKQLEDLLSRVEDIRSQVTEKAKKKSNNNKTKRGRKKKLFYFLQLLVMYVHFKSQG